MPNKKNTNGFSILEIVIALNIVTVGLLGVFSLVIQNLQAQTINKDYLIASMLAQEGIELVRNVRDTNFLQEDQGNDWKNGIPSDTNTDIVHGGQYTINYDLEIKSVAGGFADDSTRLYIDSGKYSHANTSGLGILTPYRRLIEVYDYGDYIQVGSNVIWSERGRKHEYKAVTNLYKWW